MKNINWKSFPASMLVKAIVFIVLPVAFCCAAFMHVYNFLVVTPVTFFLKILGLIDPEIDKSDKRKVHYHARNRGTFWVLYLVLWPISRWTQKPWDKNWKPSKKSS